MTLKKARIYVHDSTIYDACLKTVRDLETAGKQTEIEKESDYRGHPIMTMIFDTSDKESVEALQTLITAITTTHAASLLSFDDVPTADTAAGVAAALTKANSDLKKADDNAQAALNKLATLKTKTKAVPVAFRSQTDAQVDAETEFYRLQRVHGEAVALRTLVNQYMHVKGQAFTSANITAALALDRSDLVEAVQNAIPRS